WPIRSPARHTSIAGCHDEAQRRQGRAGRSRATVEEPDPLETRSLAEPPRDGHDVAHAIPRIRDGLNGRLLPEIRPREPVERAVSLHAEVAFDGVLRSIGESTKNWAARSAPASGVHESTAQSPHTKYVYDSSLISRAASSWYAPQASGRLPPA